MMAARQHIKTLANLTQKDFFGIQDITSKDIAAAFNNFAKLTLEEKGKKYDALLKSRVRLANQVEEKPRDFGAVRYDNDNLVRRHGQFDEGNEEKLYDSIDVKQMFVPDEGTRSVQQPFLQDFDLVSHNESIVQIGNASYKISEVKSIKDLHEVFQIFRSANDKVKSALRYSRKPPLTFHFDGAKEIEEFSDVDVTPSLSSRGHKAVHRQESSAPSASSEARQNIRRPQMEYDALAGPDGLQVPIHELDPMSEEYIEREFDLTKLDKFDHTLDVQIDVPMEPIQPIKAIDYLKKVRARAIKPIDKNLKQHFESTEHPYSLKPQIKLDSKGFNVYNYQVPDWGSVRRVDALNYIKKSIAYHNYDILAINKPYGIPSHGNQCSKDSFDMNSLVAEVARSMRIEKVHLAHRLDKTTTGVLLFATSETRARDLHRLFRNGEIKKTYWCITRGVPQPLKGVLDLAIGEYTVSGKSRSIPVPENLNEDKQLAKRFREARRAVTEFEVLDSSKHMALVQCKPQTGVKHQIRCHLGFGLNTPILGDHKYTHIDKIAPQKLHQRVLDALNMRQTKVRSLPMHLHAKTVVIPGAKANGETLFIEADLPTHFCQNLKALNLMRGHR